MTGCWHMIVTIPTVDCIQVWDLGPPQSPLFLCKNDNPDDWRVCIQRIQSHLCSEACDDTVPSECFTWYARVLIFSDLHSKRRLIILHFFKNLAMRESISPIGSFKVWKSFSHLYARPKYMLQSHIWVVSKQESLIIWVCVRDMSQSSLRTGQSKRVTYLVILV